jgi:hypothetical protein
MHSSSSAYSMPSSRHFSSSAGSSNTDKTSIGGGHTSVTPNKSLQESKAFQFGGFETINDKVLREMNERAKKIISTTEAAPIPDESSSNSNYQDLPTIPGSPLRQHERTASMSTSDIDSAGKKRYSSIHSRGFAKMDSITSHYAAKGHPTQPSPDQYQINDSSNSKHNYRSKSSLDLSTVIVESKLSSISISPSKRVVNKLFSVASKRRRTDQHGNMVEVESPAARLFGRNASPQFTHHLDHTSENGLQQRYARNVFERPNPVTAPPLPSKFAFSRPSTPSLSTMEEPSANGGVSSQSRYDSTHKYGTLHYHQYQKSSRSSLSSSRHLPSSLRTSSSLSSSTSSSSAHTAGARQLSPSRSLSSLSGRFDTVDTNIPRLAFGTRSHSLTSAAALSNTSSIGNSSSSISAENTEPGRRTSSMTEQQQHVNMLGRTGNFSSSQAALKSMIPRSTSLSTLRKEPSTAGRTSSLGQRRI